MNDNNKNLGTENEFGYEWDNYPEILPIHEIQFENWITPFKTKDFKDKTFLDAGCGIGRNSYWALKKGAKNCIAFDFDHRTVNVAKKNLQNFKNAKVKFLSIYDLNMPDTFDIAFSIGVIHHLKDPKIAVENLFNSLKEGGTLIIWVYAKEGNENYIRLLKTLRFFTIRLPLTIVKFISKALSIILWVTLKIIANNDYLRMIRKFSLKHLEAIIFDQLFPSISNYWTKKEVIELINNLKIKSYELNHTNNYSWTLICKKE